jgi:NADH-quinone oxidoreductase subunit N
MSRLPFMSDFVFLIPHTVLAAVGLLVLIVDFSLLRSTAPAQRNRILGMLSLIGIAATVVLAAPFVSTRLSYEKPFFLGLDLNVNSDPLLFMGSISGDLAVAWFNIFLLAMLSLVVIMSMGWDFTRDWGEYYALLIWATVGMLFLVAAEELLTLFLALEMMTICLYLLTAIQKDKRRSVEGGLKYFVYGSVSSALFLFGLSLIYGLTGTTRLPAIAQALTPKSGEMAGLGGNIAAATAVLMILVGFGFKIAAVPFHQWAPDAYEGAPAPVAAWVATGSKVASFIAMMKVMLYALGPWSYGAASELSPGWIGIVAVISAVTMTYGNFAALAQTNFKRMLAYSSIAHAGYMLVGVLAAGISMRGDEAAGAVLFYLVIYGFSNIGAFAVAAWLAKERGSDEIDDLNGVGQTYPILGVCMVLLMLSLIGMPPLAGFNAKIFMFSEALNDGGEKGRLAFRWLVALGLFNSVVSAFYYVRVLKAMFLRPPGPLPMRPAPATIRIPVLAAALIVTAFGLYPAPLLDAMTAAAEPMLTTGTKVIQFSDEPAPVQAETESPIPRNVTVR